ncbi:MAG: hypothetical protein ACLR8R_04640 [Oscillospiraceae bacterium]
MKVRSATAWASRACWWKAAGISPRTTPGRYSAMVISTTCSPSHTRSKVFASAAGCPAFSPVCPGPAPGTERDTSGAAPLLSHPPPNSSTVSKSPAAQ